tara:strand:- start:4297 stop:5025 length:729 start_codon:yes stop_codon:yes gene_type:complete
MTDKRIIDSFIDKYHLGGNIERIKWVSDNESLSAKFINDSQNLVGQITTKNFQFPVGEFGIYSTSTLSKLLGILENEVIFDVNKEGNTPSKFIISDTSMDVSFNLADPQVIPNIPAINKMEGNVEIELDEEFTTKFIKAKDAVGEEVFYISTRDGFTSKEVVFTIGNNNTNSVSFAIDIVEGGSDIELDNIPFNSDLVKEIFKHNKRFELGFVQINPKGLMTFAFKFGDLETNYYLVRNQNQ